VWHLGLYRASIFLESLISNYSPEFLFVEPFNWICRSEWGSFSALTLLVGSLTRKTVPDMTYNVFGGTLNLAQSITFDGEATKGQ